MTWVVVAVDWTPPDNIISEWENEADARTHADMLDGLALRCIARERRADDVFNGGED